VSKERVILCSDRPWGRDLQFSEGFLEEFDVIRCDSQESLELLLLETLNPVWIFFTYWSSYITREVFDKHRAVVFHMTDLPYGRGGSPLQNLILSGHVSTKLSAIACREALDSGEIYIQRDLRLEGSTQQIYSRAASLMPEMIEYLCQNHPILLQQRGRPLMFSGRSAAQSEMPAGLNSEKLYDFIRMLDAEGYPRAFIDLGPTRLVLSNASLRDGILTAAASGVEKGN